MGNNHKRILIVDDEANVRTVFSNILRKENYLVKAVKGAPQALKAIDEEGFDLALVDLGKPKKDGIEILENIKKRKSEIAVIIYTGHSSIPTAVAAIRRGATDYLNRPFSPEELKLSIRKALEKVEEDKIEKTGSLGLKIVNLDRMKKEEEEKDLDVHQ